MCQFGPHLNQVVPLLDTAKSFLNVKVSPVLSAIIVGMCPELTPIDVALLRKEELDGRYGSDAHHHLARARLLHSRDTGFMPPSAWFYSALEYRFCMERFLFTVLSLVSSEGAVTRAQEKLYTGSELRRAIQTVEPNLDDKLRYADLILQAHGTVQRTAKPDLNQLSSLHGRLGNYLHAQKRPPETTWSAEWLAKFEQVLEECDSCLGELLSIDKVLAGIPDGETGFPRWQRGDLTDDDVIRLVQNEIHRDN